MLDWNGKVAPYKHGVKLSKSYSQDPYRYNSHREDPLYFGYSEYHACHVVYKTRYL